MCQYYINIIKYNNYYSNNDINLKYYLHRYYWALIDTVEYKAIFNGEGGAFIKKLYTL